MQAQSRTEWPPDVEENEEGDMSSIQLGPGPCWAAVRFKLSQTPWEVLVSNIAGRHVHTDIVFHRNGSESKKFYFSAFMNEPFGMHFIPESAKVSDLYDNLVLPLTSDEYDACTSYLNTWVTVQLPYNYSDTLIGIPALSNTGVVGDTMFQDVDGSDPKNLRTVFCSQAAILMFRHCLDPNGKHGGFVKRLQGLNSRLTSPEVLFQHMQEFASPIENRELFFSIEGQ